MVETVEACLETVRDQPPAAPPEVAPRVSHSEPETVWHKLDHLLYLPLLGLRRPRDLYYYQGQGLNLLHGFTYKYLTLEHFLGELTQLQMGYPLADALVHRYGQACYIQKSRRSLSLFRQNVLLGGDVRLRGIFRMGRKIFLQ